jgi:hypothetical protein
MSASHSFFLAPRFAYDDGGFNLSLSQASGVMFQPYFGLCFCNSVSLSEVVQPLLPICHHRLSQTLLRRAALLLGSDHDSFLWC